MPGIGASVEFADLSRGRSGRRVHSLPSFGVRTMKFLRSILVVALLQATAVASALAADGLAQIKSAGVFRVGTEGTYAPFT